MAADWAWGSDVAGSGAGVVKVSYRTGRAGTVVAMAGTEMGMVGRKNSNSGAGAGVGCGKAGTASMGWMTAVM